MPRRTAAPATPAPSTSLRPSSTVPPPDDPFHEQVALLRRQWKWAAFSQFFYTFAPLFAVNDVNLTDIEDDLTRSTSIVLPRIVHRLLFTLSGDRKLNLDNWQTVLRKQYFRRDPAANPIGPEPVVSISTPSPEPHSFPAEDVKEHSQIPAARSPMPLGPINGSISSNMQDPDPEPNPEPLVIEPTPSRSGTEPRLIKDEPLPTDQLDQADAEESKNWLDLPMITKLNSLHLLTEWQFQNPNRLRQIMKDDDETAQWRVEPIGYDAKTNAYWLIGPDRLWIQRVLPKPPRTLKRKRPALKVSQKPKRARAAEVSESESDREALPASKKRKAPAKSTPAPPPPSTPARATHARRGAPAVEDPPSAGRGSRAAKTQANIKLDAQAKELAELQRQAAAESKRAGKRTAATASYAPPSTHSPRKMAVGTRVSARLRGAATVEAEWQEIPAEWLNESSDQVGEGSGGAGKAQSAGAQAKSADSTKAENLALKTGLENDDDAVSELTALSDETDDPVPVEPPKKQASKRKAGSKKAANSRSRGKGRGTVRQAPAPRSAEDTDIEEPEPAEEPEPEWHPPDDFVEWETICVTLYDWEHIAERFEKATHYHEKALYKMLNDFIIPPITAELREAEQQRRLEEAITRRKRSSRLAIKESEKEEIRLAALRKAEEEEKQSRAKRMEARLKREEEERENRESAREKRRREREEREDRKSQKRKLEESSSASTPIDVEGDGASRNHVSAKKTGKTSSASGSRTPAGEDWELDCEICHRRGVNQDDGVPLLCCGKCSKWQHIACHDQADRAAGRPRRNWDTEEFMCRRCRFPSGYLGSNDVQRTNGAAAPDYNTGVGRASYQAYQHGLASQTAYSYGQTNPYAAKDPRYDQSSARMQATGSTPYHQQTAFTFTHYQPQQQGFSTTHPQPQPYSSGSNGHSHGPFNGSMNRSAPSQQFTHRPYVPAISNGNHWPTAAVQAQPSKAAPSYGSNPMNTMPTNGYSQYTSSAERSSVGTSHEHGGVNMNAAPAHPQWSQAQPSSSYLGPSAGQPIHPAHQYPPEQYHYSSGSQPRLS